MATEEGSSSSSAKVRLVRCPKCANLLHELNNYSVYQCGGCGALLRAKKKVNNLDGGEQLDMERDADGIVKLETLSEKEDVGSDLGLPFEVEKDKRNVNRGRERFFKERTSNYREASIDSGNRIVDEPILGYQRQVEKGDIGYNEKYRMPLKQPIGPIGNWVDQEDVTDMNMSRCESVNSSRREGMSKMPAQFKGSVGSLRARASAEPWGLDRNGVAAPYGNFRMDDGGSRYPRAGRPYHDEGPSNYNYIKSSSYAHGQSLKKFNDLDGPNRFAHLEEDRVELLRKLDELTEQISRNGSVAEKRRDPSPFDVRIAPSGVYNDDRYDVPMKPLAPDKHVPRPNYFKQTGYDGAAGKSTQDMHMQNFYFHANEFSVHVDPVQLQMPRSDSRQSRNHYFQQPHRDYYHGTHMDFDQEHHASYPHRTMYHDRACACHDCYNKKLRVPSLVPATISANRHFAEKQIDSNFKQHVNPMGFGSRNHNHPALRSQDPKSHAMWPSEIDSDIDGLRKSRPRRVVVAHGKRRICHPIASGAPFIACCSCFAILNLPRKLKAGEKNQQKLQCGSCSTVFLIEIKNKKLIISIPMDNKQISPEACDVSKENSPSPLSGFSAEGMNHSVDFDNIGYDFQSEDVQGNRLPPEQPKRNIAESRTRQTSTSPSSASSEEGDISHSMIVQRDVSDLPQRPLKENSSPPFPHSSTPKHSVDVSSSHEINRNGPGNQSNRADKEKLLPDKMTSPRKSVTDESSETEVEVSFNDFLNTTTSLDSMEVSKEESQSRINKGSESFLVGLLKRSMRDFSRQNQSSGNERANVFINGKPIPDSMVKKAEKLAGQIHPGDYWYDSQAGFWGLMGHPCCGIIPPCIKEFNHPMPVNCSSGNTGIFVNGRELHQKDLELLVNRGLPATKEKFYIIEISGRVVDKETGKELKNLGKLAPTVEKMKKGFGMKIPRRSF